MKKLLLILTAFLSIFPLTACGNKDDLTTKNEKNPTEFLDSEDVDVTNNQVDGEKVVGENMDGKEGHADVTHSTWGKIPEGLKEAKNPKFKVGDKVIINAAHDADMQGSEGTVVGAYESTVYSITYTSTTGVQEENKKWFVREEIEPLGEKTLNIGDRVIIEADREEGMKGAEGTIDTAEETVVYMVDYVNKDGEKVENYQWLKESELSPAK
ncbi:DUF1541 domain-containing protein [Ureibacillus sp. FSL K6-8385]|uniref:DUF1541 domain-containing protein n=1 Tax=Ureibacillus terrenus TaxID=118246 RepID=A0A540V5K9_9BACL|nr:YdhK family protein [Ureibacillus terrenus]TQE92047.1 DUF1541 domain-containing protein [Ureibacillus terrenus]